MKTKVIFRKWHNGQIVALFPEVPHDVNGIYCSSYEQIGQHGAADAGGVIQRTAAATPAEYADIHAELVRIGYDLEVRTRGRADSYLIRRAVIAAIAPRLTLPRLVSLNPA